MDKNKALQKLLGGTATKKEIEALKQALADGEISIGGDVNRSVVIIGSGNKVELTSEALGILKPESTTEEPIAGESPYMGLRYFDTTDADLFFGREALTAELLKRVKNESFLAIVGASGSGKSSVARAGLIPAWKKENERYIIHVITPTVHPLESLATSLTQKSESVTATSTLMDDLARDARSLRLYVKKSLGEAKLLLLVDQFEETFTLCKDVDERKAFIENLLSLTDEDGNARVVITLRADFYHHCFEYEGLRLTLERHQANLGAMSQEELREAITAPAKNNGWEFQPGLVDLILQDSGTEPGALPLLSHALLETWKRRQGRTLTLEGYVDSGGVKKAIAQTAERVYDRLTPAEQMIARGIFLRLTELGEGLQDTRRRVHIDELSQFLVGRELVERVLRILIDARLVTTGQNSAEIAHEALISEWATLRRWLDEDRTNLRFHFHLIESAREWDRRGRDLGDLYRSSRLRDAKEWFKSHGNLISQLEKEFLDASILASRQERGRWLAAIYLFTVLVSLIYLSQYGYLSKFINKPVDMNDYWVMIPSGEFTIGSESGDSDEKPVQIVYLDNFQIGKYEITNRQYEQCVKAGVCTGGAFIDDDDNYPVVNVTWYNARVYCEWVGGRLPTEAEWEKAARGTDGRIFPWGNDDPSSQLLNYDLQISSLSPVGQYPKGQSPYGLYDMAGNVWEWTSNIYQAYPYNYLEDDNLSSPKDRVIRGGSWGNESFKVRSANRSLASPGSTYFDIGFRCARNVP